MSDEQNSIDHGPVVSRILHSLPADALQRVRGHAAAIDLCVEDINKQLRHNYERIAELKKAIEWRRNAAVVLKGTALAGGLVLVSGYLADYARAVGLVVGATALIDLLMRNHQQLMSAADEEARLDELIQSVGDAVSAGIVALRLISSDGEKAITSYADFMERLQKSIRSGGREVRKVSHEWQRAALTRLDPAAASPTSIVPAVPAGPTASSVSRLDGKDPGDTK